MQSRRVLIVDDNVDAAECLGELLRVSGHQIHMVHDGFAALSEAARLRPEVVILDIGLPGMDGYQVARRLRAEVGLTSALLMAVSGYTQDYDKECARAAGFDHHLAKPFEIAKLAALLESGATK